MGQYLINFMYRSIEKLFKKGAVTEGRKKH